MENTVRVFFQGKACLLFSIMKMFPPGAKSWHAYKNPRIACHTAPCVYKYDLTLSYLPVGIKTQETNTNADTLATAIV